MNTQYLTDKIHFSANANILWIGWFFALICFAISVLVYSYHWKNYGTNDRFMRLVQTVYTSVGAILLFLAAVLINFR